MCPSSHAAIFFANFTNSSADGETLGRLSHMEGMFCSHRCWFPSVSLSFITFSFGSAQNVSVLDLDSFDLVLFDLGIF